jgi:hypothetical protein
VWARESLLFRRLGVSRNRELTSTGEQDDPIKKEWRRPMPGDRGRMVERGEEQTLSPAQTRDFLKAQCHQEKLTFDPARDILKGGMKHQGEGSGTKKGGPSSWNIEQYIYKEEPRDDRESWHSDPRLELAQQSHDQQQGRDFIPSDEEDCGYGSSTFGSSFMSHLDASASFASDLGTLAGRGSGFSRAELYAKRKMGIGYWDVELYRVTPDQKCTPQQKAAYREFERLKTAYKNAERRGIPLVIPS